MLMAQRGNKEKGDADDAKRRLSEDRIGTLNRERFGVKCPQVRARQGKRSPERMKGRVARADAALDLGAHRLLAEAAPELPAL